MSRLFNLICSAAVFVAASSSVFADTNEITQTVQTRPATHNQQQPFEQGMGLPANKYPCAYNAPACVSLKGGYDFNVFGSFIYWHASQENMDIAYVPFAPTTSTATTIPGAVAYQDFSYEPGFKVGVGFNTNYDGWVCWAEYTWLHQSVDTYLTAPATPTGTAGTWTASDWFTYATAATPPVRNTGTAVSSKWKMHMDMVDLVFSRPFYEGTQLTTSPYAGFRGLWLRQNMNITMVQTVATNNSTSQNRSQCWSLGPVAGVLGHWLLGGGFRFEGNTAMSILYTSYTKLSHSEQDSPAVTAGIVGVSGEASNNVNVLRPTAQIGVGLGWGMYLGNNGSYLDISARYDFLQFWSQNMMRQWIGAAQGQADPAGDLQMHGLTANLRFDF